MPDPLSKLAAALSERPGKLTIQTYAEWDECWRRSKAGQFQIQSMDIGKPGGDFLYKLTLYWPAREEQETFL